MNNNSMNAKIELMPEEVKLLQNRKVQEKHAKHIEQELTAMMTEKSARVFQRNVIKSSGKSLNKIIWHLSDMDLYYDVNYDKLVVLLDEGIERLNRKVKPLKKQHQLSTELVNRIQKEFLDKITSRKRLEGAKVVDRKKLPVGKETQ